MRLSKHIDENKDAALAAWTLIQKHCKPFLKDWMPIVKSRRYIPYLYRGMDTLMEVGTRKTRKDRRPSQSSTDFHNAIDDLMFKKFKIRGRSSTVFVTADIDEAYGYGQEYLIFPIGKYNLLYSPEIQDLTVVAHTKYGYTHDTSLALSKRIKKAGISLKDVDGIEKLTNTMHQDNEKAIKKIIKTYKKNDLKGAIDSQNEIMLECDSYVYLRGNWQDELDKLIKESL